MDVICIRRPSRPLAHNVVANHGLPSVTLAVMVGVLTEPYPQVLAFLETTFMDPEETLFSAMRGHCVCFTFHTASVLMGVG